MQSVSQILISNRNMSALVSGIFLFCSIAEHRSLPLINGSTLILPATLECLEPGEWLSDEIIDFGS